MRVSQKSEYALQAILELCLNKDQSRPMRTADLARRQRIPEKFLELILVELRRAGLITSQRGPVGGHRLARQPEDISVGDVWRAVESGLKTGASTSKKEDTFQFIWKQVDEAIAGVVDNVSFGDLLERIKKSAIDFNI